MSVQKKQSKKTREQRAAASNTKSRPKVEPKPASKEKKTGGSSFVTGLVKAVVYIVSILVLSGFLGYFIIVLGNDIFAFVKPDDTVAVTIPENADIDDITQILYEAGAIRYPSVFRFYSKLKEDDGKFIAGDYEIAVNLNYDELLSSFKYKYVRKIVRITIPEGLTTDSIINLFLSYGISSREDFEDALNNFDFDFDFVRELDALYEANPSLKNTRTYRLDGYLFPDTYDFYTDSSAVNVIYRLLDNFDKKMTSVYRAHASELGFTIDQIVSIASLIQKEAFYLDEYEYVSSVFHNRLKSNEFLHLESDATLAYCLEVMNGVRPDIIKPEHKEIDFPYNTYKCNGLPPGPIANPGYDAIVVAIYPAASSYYYFYTASDGRTIFSRTLAEHNNAIRNDAANKVN